MHSSAAAFLLSLLFLLTHGSLRGEVEPGTDGDRLLDAEIVTVGMDHAAGAPVVLLRETEGGRELPIWIGLAEAKAIIHALHEIETPRPMTHDLTIDLLASADARLEEVVVTGARDGIFYALIRLGLPDREEPIEIDCRPSDGLALAARTGARIRVAESVLTDAPEIDFAPPESTDQVVRVLGLTVVNSTKALREELGLPDREGLVITGVRTPAAGRDFRRGDVIIRVNGIVPETPMEFLEEVMNAQGGEEVTVDLWRDGEEKQIKLPPATQPEGTISI